MKKYFQIAILLSLTSCSEKKTSDKELALKDNESTFVIIDQPNTVVGDKIKSLETQAGFKNISLGKTFASFKFGQDWLVKRKTGSFGRDYGDTVITAYNSSYHQQIGESKIKGIDLTFIKDTLIFIEVEMEPKIYSKLHLIGQDFEPNLYPILLERFGNPNKIKYQFATASDQCNALFEPLLTPSSNSDFERKHNPYLHSNRPKDHFIAKWQSNDIVMELIEVPGQIIENGFQSNNEYQIYETIRYFNSKSVSAGAQICERSQKQEEEEFIRKRKEKLKEDGSKL